MFSLLQAKARQLSERLFRSKHIKVSKERCYYYYERIIDCHAKILPSSGYENNVAQTKQTGGLGLHLISPRFSPLNCCLSVVL